MKGDAVHLIGMATQASEAVTGPWSSCEVSHRLIVWSFEPRPAGHRVVDQARTRLPVCPVRTTGGRVSCAPWSAVRSQSRTVPSFPAEASQRPRGSKRHGQHGIGMALQQDLDGTAGIVMQAHGSPRSAWGPAREPPMGEPALLARGIGGERAGVASMPRPAFLHLPTQVRASVLADHPGDTDQTRMVLSSLTETNSSPVGGEQQVTNDRLVPTGFEDQLGRGLRPGAHLGGASRAWLAPVVASRGQASTRQATLITQQK